MARTPRPSDLKQRHGTLSSPQASLEAQLPEKAAASSGYEPERRVRTALYKNLETVLHGMIGFVPMHSILRKLVDDHSSAELGDMVTLLVTMLKSYDFDIEILETANDLIGALPPAPAPLRGVEARALFCAP